MLKRFLVLFCLCMCVPICASAQLDEADKPNDNAIITYAEFDGNDDTSLWGAFSSTGTFSSYKKIGSVADDMIATYPQNTSFGRWGIRFGTGSKAYQVPSSNKNIYLTTKFKATVTDGKKTAADITTNILAIDGKCISPALDTKGIVSVGVKGGVLSYGDESAMSTTNYSIALNTWYYVKVRLNYATKTAYATIWDDDNNTTSLEWPFLWGSTFENITQITSMQNDKMGITYYVDYLYAWDDSFKVSRTSLDDSVSEVRSDSLIDIEFTKNVNADTATNITIKNSNGASLPLSIETVNNKITLFPITGLVYDTDYTLTIPDAVKDTSGNSVAEGTYTFHTEYPPYRVWDEAASVDGSNVSVSVKADNATGEDKTFDLLTIVYDSNSKLVKLKNEKVTVPDNSQGYEATFNYDVDGAESAYCIVWDGFTE